MDNNQELLKTVKEKAMLWLSDQYDEATRAEVKQMLEAEDPTQLIESSIRISNSARAACAA